MTPSSSDQLLYRWSRIICEKEEIIKDEECFRNSDTSTLTIDCFESKHVGTYQCVITSSSRPVVSTSVEMELDLPGKINAHARCSVVSAVEYSHFKKMNIFLYTEPPEDFSPEMSNRKFLLFLNTNGVCYKVCKILKGITK